MRDPKRIGVILDLLGQYWTMDAGTMDLRLGQLLFSLKLSGDLFYVEDDKFIEALEEQIKKVKENE